VAKQQDASDPQLELPLGGDSPPPDDVGSLPAASDTAGATERAADAAEDAEASASASAATEALADAGKPSGPEASGATQQKAAGQEAAEEFQSIREVGDKYGLDLSQYADDEAALKALAEQVQRGKQLEDFYRRQISERLSGEESKQATAAEAPKLWDPPEYSSSWLSQVTYDDEGGLVPNYKAGGTPETVAKFQRYLQYRQDQQERFWQDPFSYIKPFVQQQVEARAKELLDSEIQQYSNRQRAEGFVQQNSDWLFAKDSGGNRIMVNGSPVLSQEGKAFQGYISKAEQLGLPLESQEQYAMDMLGAYRAQQAAANKPEETSAAIKNNFLQSAAAHQPNEAATTNLTPAADGTPPAQNPNLSLADMMRQNLKAAGITDEDMVGSF
jgi:hypothetical protein